MWDVLTDVRKMAMYSLALMPLVPAYFLLKPLRMAASDPAYLGYALMVTATLLFAASSKKVDVLALGGAGGLPRGSSAFCVLRSAFNMLCIGLMQTMALVPGISRSGSTISAARFCGWEWREAARFSFLLSIPTILGGELLETLKGHAGGGVSVPCYVGGFVASFGLGLVAVRFVFWVYEKGKVRPFAWYCLGVGLFAWIAFNG